MDHITRTIELVRGELCKQRHAHALPDIDENTSFERDLLCDVIDMLCIEITVGDAFGIEFPARRLDQCHTVGDLAALAAELAAGLAVKETIHV